MHHDRHGKSQSKLADGYRESEGQHDTVLAEVSQLVIYSSPDVSGNLRITPVGSTNSTRGSASSVIGMNVAGDRGFVRRIKASLRYL